MGESAIAELGRLDVILVDTPGGTSWKLKS